MEEGATTSCITSTSTRIDEQPSLVGFGYSQMMHYPVQYMDTTSSSTMRTDVSWTMCGKKYEYGDYYVRYV